MAVETRVGADVAPAPAAPRTALLLGVLVAAALAACAAFLLVGVQGSWSYAIPFRATKLAGLVIVGVAIAVSTVVFQTVTANRILTPAVIGLDSLFVLLATLVVFFLGGFVGVDPWMRFLVVTGAMTGFALLLFRGLFGRSGRALATVVLVGVVLGTLFRSVAQFVQRLLDPASFTVLQDALFASFNSPERELLGVTALITAAASLLVWRKRRELDVLALGEPVAVSLGVDHRRATTRLLLLVAVLVSASTALVGPVLFFGLLVASIAHLVMRSHRHALLLPATALIAVITLVAGQTLLERAFSLDTVLSVVVEFAGGLLFIALVLRRGLR